MKKSLFLLFFIVTCFSASGIFALDKIEINTASLAQLDTLTGIGPKYAQAIIAARPFSSVDDLLKVKGIGPTTLQKIKDQGLAYVEGQGQQPVQKVTTALTPEPIAEILPQITAYAGGIFINEILTNPKGADGTDEWIELYNSNNFEIDLTGWQIKDTAGTVKTFTLSTGTKISAYGFLILKRPDTGIMLNNEGDGLNLMAPDKKAIDSVTFGKAPLGQSYNKTTSGFAWSTTLTPGAKNIVTAVAKTLPASATPKALQAGLPNAKNSVKNDGVEVGLADLSQTVNQDDAKTNPWFLFFTVLAITIILAVIVLLIKFRIRKTDEEPRPL